MIFEVVYLALTEVIVKFSGDIFSVAQNLFGQAELLSDDYAILTVDEERIYELYQYVEIEDIELSKELFLPSFSFNSSCIAYPKSTAGYDLHGDGVITAVIDSGIDYAHPDFRSPDGTTRILFIWDQTISGTPPDGFKKGREISGSDINAALSGDPSAAPTEDVIGHGTAVTGIAAGSSENGVADRSDIIAVKVGSRLTDYFALSTDIMRALKYTVDKAQSLKKPVSINLSFGMNNGSHRGDSLFEQYIDSVVSRWKCCICVPTGNEGSSAHHYSTVLRSYEEKTVNFFTASGIDSFYLDLRKNFTDSFTVELVFPDGTGSGEIGVYDMQKTFRHRGAVLTALYSQPLRYTVGQEVFLRVRSDSILPSGGWRLIIRSGRITDGRIDIWLPVLEEVTSGTYFADADIYNTMTIPSTANRAIKVAGYNDRTGSIADFSGVGGYVYPDIAAPCVNILSARSGGGYDSFTGTSFASPFVCGACALIMQWGIVLGNSPFLYGERVKAYLRLGAERTGGRAYPDPFFGYGTLCLRNTLDSLEEQKDGYPD